MDSCFSVLGMYIQSSYYRQFVNVHKVGETVKTAGTDSDVVEAGIDC